MSTVPPSMPPGGGVPPQMPPYDPKTQWRIYREQQKAAWRAQRDAWRAQQHAWKAGYVGAYGPRVPSMVGPVILVAVGVVALLLATGHIASSAFWSWYGRWWPLLLIGAGLLLLAEWALDLRRETPVRRSGSFIGLLILLAIVGAGATGFNHMDNWFDRWGDHDNDFFNSFGAPEHVQDVQLLSTTLGANPAIEIEDPRGDISITGGEGSGVSVQAHEIARIETDEEAKKVFEAEKPSVVVSGSTVVVKSAGHDRGWLGLTVVVPKSAKVTIHAGHGDVLASGLGAGINVTARGDVKLDSIKGAVEAHLTNGKHDLSALSVEGDVSLDGETNDVTLTDIKGRITQSGEISGDVHMTNIAGAVKLHTTVTDLDLASLPGTLSLNPDDLRISEAKGEVRVKTRSKKDVVLNEIWGDTYVENRNGSISISPAGPYNVQAINSSGEGNIEVTLPPNASATVDGRTRNGEIVNDFSLQVSGDESKTVQGRIGGGAAKITMSTEQGDLTIKKGAAFPATPAAPVAPAAPPAPGAHQLKSAKPLPPPTKQ
ncbi:MAG: DUF4097 family beta strand repeat-containing protein [Terracidiphilus sp.]